MDADIAYCLMGLFGVNMPLLYGEGKGAFLRLQKEIRKTRITRQYLRGRPLRYRRASTVASLQPIPRLLQRLAESCATRILAIANPLV